MDATFFNDQHDEVFDDLIARFSSELGQKKIAKGHNTSDLLRIRTKKNSKRS